MGKYDDVAWSWFSQWEKGGINIEWDKERKNPVEVLKKLELAIKTGTHDSVKEKIHYVYTVMCVHIYIYRPGNNNTLGNQYN